MILRGRRYAETHWRVTRQTHATAAVIYTDERDVFDNNKSDEKLRARRFRHCEHVKTNAADKSL